MRKKWLAAALCLLLLMLCSTAMAKGMFVTFDMNGHGEQVPEQVLVYGEKATEPDEPTAEGYTFLYWVDANNDLWDFDTPVTDDVTLTAVWDAVYEITGGDVTIQKGSGTKLTLVAKAPYADFFIMCLIDETQSVEIDKTNFDIAAAEDGSQTVITLHSDYLDTLQAGKYELALIFDYGVGTTNLTITAPKSAPATGDDMPLTAIMMQMALCLTVAAVIGVQKKRG